MKKENAIILERYCPIVEKNVVLQTQPLGKENKVHCLNLDKCNTCKNAYKSSAVL